MKKYSVFIIAILTTCSLSMAASAKNKKEGLVKSFGNALTNSVKTGTNKNVKGGIYGKSTLDATDAKPTVTGIKTAGTTPVAGAKVEPAVVGNTNNIVTGVPVNIGVVRRNQSKEELLASGILFLSAKDYGKALDSFKKAQAISNDIVVQRWVDVANNKIKIKSMSPISDDLKPLSN